MIFFCSVESGGGMLAAVWAGWWVDESSHKNLLVLLK